MKQKYIDLMEKCLSAYSKEHILRYFNEVKENGLTEHGFPRLTSNMGILISRGRCLDLLPLFLEMMDFCCKEIPGKKAANDFSVREIICCIAEVEESGVVDSGKIDSWKNSLRNINIEQTYNKFAKSPKDNVRNWALFTAVSEYYRQSAGLCDSADFIELQLCQQLQWLDENGMYRDNEWAQNHQPMVYDLVSRGLFTLLLDHGYRGKYYTEIDAALKKSALLTLDMQSPNGEIPYGGRSNQFLHNEPWLCAICEYEAKRYKAEGKNLLAKKFKAAAKRALSVTEYWLSKNPIRHIKNRYPTETKYGCEEYAYFDKYMITAASMLYAAYSVCDESIEAEEIADREPCIVKTSAAFHKLFLKSMGYGIEFDFEADPHYDSKGLGRVHLDGAPSTICLSTPCPKNPEIVLKDSERIALSLCSGIKNGAEWIFGADESLKYELVETSQRGDVVSAVINCNFENGSSTREEFSVSAEGVSVLARGEGEVGFAIPAFFFDGEKNTEISANKNLLSVKYEGYECRYTTDGEIINLNKIAENRNGQYKAFVAVANKEVRVKIEIFDLSKKDK